MAVSAKRNARIEINASAKGVKAGVDDARRQLRMFQRDQAKADRDGARAAEKSAKDRQKRLTAGASNVAGGVKAGLGAALGLDAIGGIEGLIGSYRDVEKEMTRFQIDAQLGADKMAEFRAEAMRVSNATGVSRQSIVEAAHGYQVLTGDSEGARKSIALFADVALASGASMTDIAAVAASFKKNLSIDPADFRKGFDVLQNMGHRGSVELRDFAEELSGVAPQFKDFASGSSTRSLAEMAATFEVLRNNFKGSSETATGFRSLMTALVKKQAELAKYGVQVFRVDPKTKKLVQRDFFDIVNDILKNPKLDAKILPKLLGRSEAARALGALRDHWQEAQDLMNGSQNSDQIAKDATAYLESPTGKIERAWERIKNAIAAALTPERVEGFANAIEGLAAHLQPLIDSLSAVAGLVGSVYSFGQKIRGKLPGGDGHLDTARGGSDVILQGDGIIDTAAQLEMARREGWSPEELAHRKAGARGYAASAHAHNAAVDSIMGAENDERVTPASIYAAMSAKYSKGVGADGAYQAGNEYLKAAHYDDPVEREQKRMASMSSDAQMAKIVQAIGEGFNQVRINLDGHAVGKGVANSSGGATRPGRH